MKLRLFSILILITVFAWNAMAADGDVLLGKWWNGPKDAHIEIYKCGEKFCGNIVFLSEPNEVDGTPKIDDENPDESLQKRPLMGLDILEGFIYEGKNKWEDGTIYNPKDGKTYSCYIYLQDDGILKVRGYIGVSLLGKTQYWERVK